MYIPDKTDCPCSLKLCCHGSLNVARAVRPVSLRFREAEWLQTHTEEGPNGRADTCPLTLILSYIYIYFFFTFFFSSVIAHMHISHHKDSSCQGQRGPCFSLSVDYKHTRRWPARPVYPQMATVEWSVWKVSCDTRTASLSPGSPVSDGHFGPHSAGWCGDGEPSRVSVSAGGSYSSAGENGRETKRNYKWVLNICCVLGINSFGI